MKPVKAVLIDKGVDVAIDFVGLPMKVGGRRIHDELRHEDFFAIWTTPGPLISEMGQIRDALSERQKEDEVHRPFSVARRITFATPTC